SFVYSTPAMTVRPEGSLIVAGSSNAYPGDPKCVRPPAISPDCPIRTETPLLRGRGLAYGRSSPPTNVKPPVPSGTTVGVKHCFHSGAMRLIVRAIVLSKRESNDPSALMRTTLGPPHMANIDHCPNA